LCADNSLKHCNKYKLDVTAKRVAGNRDNSPVAVARTAK
jgi:hypothetical protein